MKITIEIDDNDFQKRVESELVRRTCDAAERELFQANGRLRYGAYTDIRKCIREVLKEHMDSLSKQAVDAAAKSIENRAIKNQADKLIQQQAGKITEAILNG